MERRDSREPVHVPYELWTPLWQANARHRSDLEPRSYYDPYEALFRIQRGLAGHVSFLASCDANIVFTEYLLYEPILAILRTMKYEVECEVPSVGAAAAAVGDYRRIDFFATKDNVKIALEVKWLRWDDDDERDYLDIKRDTEKLIAARDAQQAGRCFLCVFGRHSQTAVFHGGKAQAQLANFDEALPPLYADFRRTIFGSRIFELKANQTEQTSTVLRQDSLLSPE